MKEHILNGDITALKTNEPCADIPVIEVTVRVIASQARIKELRLGKSCMLTFPGEG